MGRSEHQRSEQLVWQEQQSTREYIRAALSARTTLRVLTGSNFLDMTSASEQRGESLSHLPPAPRCPLLFREAGKDQPCAFQRQPATGAPGREPEAGSEGVGVSGACEQRRTGDSPATR